MWWWNEEVKDAIARQHIKKYAGFYQKIVRPNTSVIERKPARS